MGDVELKGFNFRKGCAHRVAQMIADAPSESYLRNLYELWRMHPHSLEEGIRIAALFKDRLPTIERDFPGQQPEPGPAKETI